MTVKIPAVIRIDTPCREEGLTWQGPRTEAPAPVSIVMPVYNEAAYIERSLTAVLSQNYPADMMEVVIAVSQSDDDTVACIRRVIARNPNRRIRLLDNPHRTPGAALNRMIREAAGDFVVRVDGHTEIAPDYVRSCVAALQSTDAMNVGGCISASGQGFMGQAIAAGIRSFWGNGGARFRCPPVACPTYVDTVPFGAWRRETFSSLGLFVEQWSVNEDCEFNSRILDAGGRILLHPAIKATYFSRSSLHLLAKQYFRYGKLKCEVIARHPKRLRARQLAPPLFVLTLVVLLLVGVLGKTRTSLPLIAPIGYLLTIGIASIQMAFRNKRPGYALVLPAVLATLHFSYGVGALLGAGRLLRYLTHTTRRERAPALDSRTVI